ncbi:MAG: hypothetical protein Fur0022_28960 [Anaerolineales bacterium]
MWQYTLNPSTDWHPVQIPSAWEETGLPKDFSGPVWFRTTLPLPEIHPDRRYWLRFFAVSYHCQVDANGHPVGEHTGAWDTFSLEITDAVIASPEPRGGAEILIRITKPASLTAGPDSPPSPGDHPLRETLAGFLPYVWGHAFGGIWQPVELYTTGLAYIQEAFIRGDAEGQLHLEATLSHASRLHLQILDPAGRLIFSTTFPPALKIDHSQFKIDHDHILTWSPATPARYTARLTLENGDEKTLSFGFRTLSTEGSTILLNHQPIYPRFILSWGWYPDRMCPNPGPERVRADFIRLKAMGYNGVKLCLWFPPQYVFDLADEIGLFLWVEFPIWLPQVTTFFRTQTPLELERLTRLARQHPSVLFYTLGCELGPDIDRAFLETLYQHLKTLIGDSFLAGNSGSGEAYGGPLNETADFYDHHFYAEPYFLSNLLDTFSPHWRTPKPWLMGEFNDFDTLRNWPQLLEPDESPAPSFWWLKDTPQGARWAMEVYEQETRLKTLGLWKQTPTLSQLSLQKALLYRKLTLETIRARPTLSGYVITGEADTPISTAGMWDDRGHPKFAPEDFRQFNQDTMLLLGFRRWRAWVAGGDRPKYVDRFCCWAGDALRIALVVSHFGKMHKVGSYRWEIAFEGESPFARGEGRIEGAVTPGQVREIAMVELVAPEVETPRKAILRAALSVGEPENESKNEWPIWIFPRDVWEGISPFVLDDPAGRLADLKERKTALCGGDWKKCRVGVFTRWTPQAADFVQKGGRAVVLQAGEPEPLPVVPRPFWRECIQIGLPHPAWGRFPFAFGTQFYALGTDHVLGTTPYSGAPLFQRLDTRQMILENYAVELEIGRGRAIVTTLRLEGGLGDQPSGITRSPGALFLLAEWLRWLAA